MSGSRTVNVSHTSESSGFDVYPCVADACDTDNGMDSGTFHLLLNCRALLQMLVAHILLGPDKMAQSRKHVAFHER